MDILHSIEMRTVRFEFSETKAILECQKLGGCLSAFFHPWFIRHSSHLVVTCSLQRMSSFCRNLRNSPGLAGPIPKEIDRLSHLYASWVLETSGAPVLGNQLVLVLYRDYFLHSVRNRQLNLRAVWWDGKKTIPWWLITTQSMLFAVVTRRCDVNVQGFIEL